MLEKAPSISSMASRNWVWAVLRLVLHVWVAASSRAAMSSLKLAAEPVAAAGAPTERQATHTSAADKAHSTHAAPGSPAARAAPAASQVATTPVGIQRGDAPAATDLPVSGANHGKNADLIICIANSILSKRLECAKSISRNH